MFRHNLLLFYRNFKKHKTTFLVNLVGLSCGLACVLVIYLWVTDELSFDKYHANDKRLYQVMANNKTESGVETNGNTPHILSEVLASEMPEVEYITTTTPDKCFPAFTLSAHNKKIQGTGKFAGKDFFKIFSYHLLRGNESNVLSNKNAIVLSESEAVDLFGSADNIIGRTISYKVVGIERQCVVTGIFKDVPANSSERFDFVLSYNDLKDMMQMGSNWGTDLACTYLTVRKGTNIERLNDKLTKYIRSKSKNTNRSYFLKRFSDNYLYNRYENGKQAGGRIEYVKLFVLIALFILVISAINFMNLSTARAASRVKEIGIKKAIGAARKALIIQYLGESVLMTSLSLMIAMSIVFLLLPQFNVLTQKSLNFHLSTGFCLFLAGVTLFTGLLSGSYPALYLSGFKPAAVLKGRFNNPVAEKITRKGLVVFQFSLSVVFIVLVLVLYKQISYIENENLGFNKDNIVYFESNPKDVNAYLNEIQTLPSIERASSMIGHLVGDEYVGMGQITWNGKTIPARSFGVHYGLLETLGIKLKEGRYFSPGAPDSSNTQIILNEAAVDALGLKNPVGTIIRGKDYNTEVIGVVKNFHFQSFREKIEPMKFRLDSYGGATIVARIRMGKEKEALTELGSLFKRFNPGVVFNYKFLDQDYQALYVSERLVSTLSRYFAGLSLVISCLGLFGLAAFTAEMRTKEIGIRKVLGSSVFGIIRLLNGEFMRLILIAICIALPLSYLIAKSWLDEFVYRISLEWWYFAGAGLLTIIIALLTVSFRSVRAALVNPAASLKTE
ncbi:MAG TPA: ABC transporter permease [Mucilaginibacter sp.]|nr:ABC transporter permease [Mucilaginibacter sp.]